MQKEAAKLGRCVPPRAGCVARLTVLALVLGLAPPVAAEPASTPPPSASAPSVADREQEARKHYEAGAAAFDARQYHEAVAQFQAADELAPRAPLSFNIARAYELANDAAGALAYYREYLRRAPAAANAAVVQGRIGELERALAERGVQQLTVISEPPGAFVGVDGQASGVTPWTGELKPGKHRLSISREGYATVTRDYELDAGHASELDLTLAPAAAVAPAPTAAPPPAARVTQRPRSAAPAFGPWPWVVLGAGGATLVASVAVEVARRGAEHDARDATTQIAYSAAYRREQSRQTAARVLFGVGGVLAVAGGALLVIELTPRSRQKLAAGALCDGDGCAAALTGAF